MTSVRRKNAAIAQRVTLLGMLLDLMLGALKILIGNVSTSHALIADGIHSLSDAASDILVLAITRASHHAPDTNHPYGHARFETIGTLLLGSSLITIGLLLAYNYIELIFTEKTILTPAWPALAVALLSIISKEWIFRYTKKAGETLRSNLLIANAWHSRSDAFSSIIVLIGVAGSMAGIHWLDIIAALLIAFIVLKIGGQLVWDSIKELVDTGVESGEINALRTTVLSIKGINNVHGLRTRRMGQDVLLEIHLQVDPVISVSEGHQIGEWATKKLLEQHTFISDVIYHIDTEDDHNQLTLTNSSLLPLRNEVFTLLCDSWPEMPTIEHFTLHYLNNQINVELFINERDMAGKTTSDIEQELTTHSHHLKWLGTVRVWCHH